MPHYFIDGIPLIFDPEHDRQLFGQLFPGGFTNRSLESFLTPGSNPVGLFETDINELPYFERITTISQPHSVFKLDWHFYKSLDFADTFLPKTIGYYAKGVWMFDGAELFKGVKKTKEKLLPLDTSNKLISLITYTYPKGVEAEFKRNRAVPAKHEILTFVEVSQNEDIEIYFNFGENFINELKSKKVKLNFTEKLSAKSTISKFKKHFNNKLSHHNMMHFILKSINVEDELEQEIERDVKEEQKSTNIVRVNEEGTTLMQIKHEFASVGESIAQVKYNTSATVTGRGTVIVTQFKQEISSRGEEVWYYKNSLGTFEGTLEEAKKAFPDVDFSDIKVPSSFQKNDPEFGNVAIWPASKPLEWETINEFDAEQNEGKPTTWDKWADATQTALDIVGLIPVFGEVADCLNGVISLARGNYGDAA